MQQQRANFASWLNAACRPFGFAVLVGMGVVGVASPASAATLHPHVLAADTGGFDFFGWLASEMRGAVKLVLGFCIAIISNTPEPNLLALWYRGQYRLMFTLGAYMTIIVALIATISALLKGGLKEVLRVFLVGIPTAMIGGVVAIAVVTLLQRVDQAMTNAMLTHTTDYFNSFYDKLDANSETFGTNVAALGSAIVQVILFFLILVSCFALWIELVIRQVMIYMAVLFIPLALAAFIWAPLRGWLVGLAEVLVTMILSKFVIASVMSFGFLAISNGLGDIALFVGGMLTLITACLSVPALIIFVMAPRHDILQRRQLGQLTPLGADRSYARGALGKAAKGVKGIGKTKVPSGGATG